MYDDVFVVINFILPCQWTCKVECTDIQNVSVPPQYLCWVNLKPIRFILDLCILGESEIVQDFSNISYIIKKLIMTKL